MNQKRRKRNNKIKEGSTVTYKVMNNHKPIFLTGVVKRIEGSYITVVTYNHISDDSNIATVGDCIYNADTWAEYMHSDEEE